MRVGSRPMTTSERVVAQPEYAMVEAQKSSTLTRMVAGIEEVNSLPSYAPKNWDWKEKYAAKSSDFNAVDAIPDDMLHHIDELWDARDQQDMDQRIQRLSAEAQRRKILAEGGWAGIIGTVIGTLGSPEFLPGLLWTPAGGGILRTAAKLGFYTMGEEAIHQELLDQQTLTPTNPYQKLISIGVAGTVGAVMGGAVGAFSRQTSRGVAKEILQEYESVAFNNGIRQTDTIAESVPAVETTLGDLGRSVSAAEAGQGMLAAPIRPPLWKTGQISALRPLMRSRSPVVHRVLNRYFGHDNQLGYNAKPIYAKDATGKLILDAEGKPRKIGVEHIAKETSLERAVDRELYSMNTRGMRSIFKGFLDYTKHTGKSVMLARLKNKGELDTYYKHLRWAMSNNDTIDASSGLGNHQIEAINRTARELREVVYKPIEKLARQQEMLDVGKLEDLRGRLQRADEMIYKSANDPVELQKWTLERSKAEQELAQFEEMTTQVKYALSYANRRFNAGQIERDEVLFKDVAYQHYYAARVDAAMEKVQTRLKDKIDALRKERAETEALEGGPPPARMAELEDEIRRLEEELAQLKGKRGKGDERQDLKNRISDLRKERHAAQRAAKSKSKELTRLDNALLNLEDQLSKVKRSDFEITDNTVINEIKSEVERTYNNIVAGDFISGVFHSPTAPKPFKERVMPIPDNVLLANGWLHTDMLDQIKSYTNGTLKPLRMKEAAGDTEMSGELRAVEDNYDRLAAEVLPTNKKLADSLRSEKATVIAALQAGRDRFYGRRQLARAPYATMANFARAIRNLNIMRMMGGVLLTSLNDVTRLRLAKIFTPELGVAMPGLISALKTARISRRAYEEVGLCAEQTMMVRTSKYVDMAEPMAQGNALSKNVLNLTARGAKALMRATFLARWTDEMKGIAAAWAQNTLVRMMSNYAKLSEKNKTILAELGIDEALAGRIIKQFNTYGERHGKFATSLNWDDWDDVIARERIQDVLFRESQRILVTPNSLDLPLWADNELARSYLQFKSFSLAAHNQITIPMVERARVGDMQTMLTLGFMATNGLVVEMVKLAEAKRWSEMEEYGVGDWALAMADRSAAVPMLMMAFNDLDVFTGNLLTEDILHAMPASRVSDRTRIGLMGPTASTVTEMFKVGAALTGQGGPEAKDFRAARRIVPFNNLPVVNRLAREAEDYIDKNAPARRTKKKTPEALAEGY